MSAFEAYIRDLQEIQATKAAVKEASYYGALEKLLNELGKTLKPEVRCVMQLSNIGGAGMPDGGLFTASQFQRRSPDLRPELKTIAIPSRVGDGNLNPNTDYALTAGWSYAGQNSVTMPGKGKVVDLNNIAYWKNIPDRVWDYTIGGYQVIKKWLSYREQELLGRSLKQEEVMEVTNMARRIAAILLLEPELNANYKAVKRSTYQWTKANSHE